jgi:lipopolysaccharide export system protein LptA
MKSVRRVWLVVKLLRVLTHCVALFVLTSAHAQDTTPLVIVHADQMVGYEIDRGTVRELTGNVVLRQGSAEIRCNRARQELWSGRAELEGNILIVQGSLRMRMQRGDYHSNERRAFGYGMVVIDDGTTTLQAPLGIYELGEQRAIFYHGVHLRDSTVSITADSVVYYRRSGERFGWGNVRLYFERERTTVWGDSAYQNPTDHEARICGRSLLVQTDSVAKGDTLYLAAECLLLLRKSDDQVIRAIGNVRTIRGALVAVADSAWLWKNDSLQLIGNPIVWADSAQLTGSAIAATLRDRRVETVVATGGATLGIVDDSASVAPHQLLAAEITLRFERDSLRFVSGSHDVHTLYYHRREDGSPDGMTRVASDSISIALADGRIVRSTWYGAVKSEYVPEQHIQPAERYLQGFRWFGETKPSRDELFERWLHSAKRQ